MTAPKLTAAMCNWCGGGKRVGKDVIAPAPSCPQCKPLKLTAAQREEDGARCVDCQKVFPASQIARVEGYPLCQLCPACLAAWNPADRAAVEGDGDK